MSSPTPTSTAPEAPESLEALQQRHRKEQRDLVSRITQKKKQATKKTRKGVNDECERLEQELKERQAEELKKLNGEGGEVEEEEEEGSEPTTPSTKDDVKGAPEETTANKTTPPVSQPPKPKKNRQKDRLARRQAAQDESIRQAELEALNAPNPRELERQRFAPLLSAHQLALHEIRADGHCLYAAVADQLATRELGVQPKIDIKIAGAEEKGGYKAVRYAAAAWMERNPEEFAGFMEDPLPEHVRKIRETGEWGGHLELLALARTYGVRICVLHSDGRVDRIEDEGGEEGEKSEIWLGYYRHSHGLGEHYNSLRRVEGQAEG